MKLKEIQEEFAKHIYDKTQNKVFDVIDESDIDKNERLEIYRNNVLGNFDTALELTYEVIKKLVGDQYFESLSKKYHQKYRSKSGNLDDYGNYFHRLISSLKKEHQLPYLSDIAKLEWRYHLAYFAANTTPLDTKKLQQVPEENFSELIFKLHPSCHLFSSQYPVFTIWNNVRKNFKKEINIKNKKGELILIERSHLKTNIHNLSEIEYMFLQNIKKKSTLYKIYETLGKVDPQIAIGLLVNKFVSNGVLNNFNQG